MIPVACYRLISSNLTVIAGYFPLPGQIKQPQTDSSILGGISLPLPVRIMAYPLTWLTLITIATGTYLMNGYELFKVLPTFPYTKKTGERLSLPPVSSVSSDFSTRYSKSFFSFFSAVVTDFAMAWKEQPSISAICS